MILVSSVQQLDRRPHTSSALKRRMARLNGRGLCVPSTRNAEAVKNYPGGVRTIECVEVNAGNVVIQKIVTLFQGEVYSHPADLFTIVFAAL